MGQIVPTLKTNCFPIESRGEMRRLEHRESSAKQSFLSEAQVNDLKLRMRQLESKLLHHIDVRVESLENDTHARLDIMQEKVARLEDTINEKIVRLDDKYENKLEVLNYRMQS